MMGLTTRCAGVVSLALLAALASPARGQEAPQSPPGEAAAVRPGARAMRMGRPPAPPGPDVMTVQQVEQYFDQVVLYQAQSQLQLTDDQSLRFGASLGRLQALRRQQQRRRVVMLRELSALVNTTPLDEVAVNAKLAEVDELAAISSRQVEEAYGAIDQLLDVRQRARFRIFEEMVERRKFDLLSRARQAGAKPPAAAR